MAKNILKNAFSKEGLNKAIGSSGFSSAIGGVSGIVGSAIGGGKSTGVGNAMQGLGSIASAIPGPYGAVASAALNIGGGLVNAAFGSKLNEQFINDKESEISNVLTSTSDAMDIDTFLSDFNNRETVSDFSQSDVGSDGWFSSKAKKKYESMQRAKDIANRAAEQNFANQGENINKFNIAQLMYNVAANGGKLNMGNSIFDTGITFINNGGSHEENPFDGIQLGIDSLGVPNLVEEGEVVWNDYVFSKRLKPSKSVIKKSLLPNKYIGKSFADIATNLSREMEERPNDPISKRGRDTMLSRLQAGQEEVRMKNNKRKKNNSNLFPEGGWLRYAPAFGSILGASYNLLNGPDYTYSNQVYNAADKAGKTRGVSYKPVGTYLKYEPFDTDYYVNKINANAAANRRALTNTANGNMGALISGLALLNDKTTEGIGALSRQAAEYNLAQRQKAAEFNRATDMANSEMGLKSSIANEEAAQKANSLRLSGITQAMAMRNAIEQGRGASISAGLTGLFDNLGNIGRENFNKEMVLGIKGLTHDYLGNYLRGQDTSSSTITPATPNDSLPFGIDWKKLYTSVTNEEDPNDNLFYIRRK